MSKPSVYRSPWRNFPDVIIQTTVTKLRSRPGYDQAKRGAGEAAFEVVRELIQPKKIPFAIDTIVLSDSKLNATESPKLFATEKKSRDIIVLLLE
jgi:hypothetical protein